MRVDWTEKIAGVEIIEIRDFFRFLGWMSFGVRLLGSRLAVTEQTSLIILEQLLARNLIALSPERSAHEISYSLTPTGRQLACARAVKRIDKAKASAILEKFHGRIESVNTDHDLIFYVQKVCLFGSYIDPLAHDYGDVDVAVDLRARAIFNSELVSRCEDRARLKGKRGLKRWDAVDYCTREVEQILAARSRYLSLHTMSKLEELKAPSQIFYLGPLETSVTASITKHVAQ